MAAVVFFHDICIFLRGEKKNPLPQETVTEGTILKQCPQDWWVLLMAVSEQGVKGSSSTGMVAKLNLEWPNSGNGEITFASRKGEHFPDTVWIALVYLFPQNTKNFWSPDLLFLEAGLLWLCRVCVQALLYLCRCGHV